VVDLIVLAILLLLHREGIVVAGVAWKHALRGALQSR